MRDARWIPNKDWRRDERPFLEAPSFLDYLPYEPPAAENVEDDGDTRVIIIEI